MALVYCEICGVLMKGASEAANEHPEGVICDACYASRRAVVGAGEEHEPPATDSSSSESMVQFNCCYCRSLLRLRAVGKRTRIKCPKCNDHFYLNPDGRLESRLEGNTTAVFAADMQNLTPLTPMSGLPAPGELSGKTQPMKRGEAGPSKTQPMKRDAIALGAQHALLEELKPKKLDFLDGVPARGKEQTPHVDTDSYAQKLELAPERRGDPPTAVLRPSEEGRVDLDAEGLRRKTAKYKQAKEGEGGKTTTKKLKRPDPPAEEPPPRPEKEEKGKDARKAEKEQKKEERERRAAEAAKKSKELEAGRSRRSLGALTLTLVSLLPAVVALLFLTMTTRGVGFATRGAFGERLNDVGGAVDRGARSLGRLVNPHLPPELRLPQ